MGLLRSAVALLLLLLAIAAHAQSDPANNVFCPAELTYQDCVDEGYFNHFGNGVGGGGGGGGYCQDMKSSGGSLDTYCNGSHSTCEFSFCANSPGSHKYCEQYPFPCCDGRTGNTAVIYPCN